MKKILLVSLRSEFLDDDRVFPPIGLLQLKACVDKEGFLCDIEHDFDFNNIEKYEKYDIIGCSVMTPQGKLAKLLLSLVKLKFPDKILIIGGPHALHYSDELLGDGWDYIVKGDGEFDLLNILKGKALGKVLYSSLSVDEMNLTPLPYRSKDFLFQYKYFLDGKLATTMMTTRGCPMGCRFCEDARTGARHYSVDRVYDEAVQIKELGFGGIMFFDDINLMIQKRTLDMYSRLKELDLKFRAFAHANTATDKMLDVFSNAGGVEIGWGCEHVSQKILDNIGKNVKSKQNWDFPKRCSSRNIRVKSFLMMGLPGESIDTINELEDFLANSGVYDFDISIFYPYKGTEFRKDSEKWELLIDDSGSSGYYKGKLGQSEFAYKHKNGLTQEELSYHKDRLYKKYNKRFKNL